MFSLLGQKTKHRQSYYLLLGLVFVGHKNDAKDNNLQTKTHGSPYHVFSFVGATEENTCELIILAAPARIINLTKTMKLVVLFRFCNSYGKGFP